MGPRVMTVAPSTAISWLSYEFFSEYYSLFRCIGQTANISQRFLSVKTVSCLKQDKLSKNKERKSIKKRVVSLVMV
jgi:hypothetical protein